MQPTRRAFRGAIVIVGIIAAAALATTLWVEWPAAPTIRTHDVASAVGTALIVYHPGRSPLPGQVAEAFADGLVANGWRVDLATATAQAPTDLAPYDLLVLVTPTYWWSPALPITRYLARQGQLQGRPVALIVTASGQPTRSRQALAADVQARGGQVVATLALTQWKPNREDDPRPNERVALELATAAGQAIPPPIPGPGR